MINKVQKNQSGVYVLVQCVNSANQHYWYENVEVGQVTPLTKSEQVQLFQEAFEKMSLEEKAEIASDFLKKVRGYAISNVSSKDGFISTNDIVKLETIPQQLK